MSEVSATRCFLTGPHVISIPHSALAEQHVKLRIIPQEKTSQSVPEGVGQHKILQLQDILTTSFLPLTRLLRLMCLAADDHSSVLLSVSGPDNCSDALNIFDAQRYMGSDSAGWRVWTLGVVLCLAEVNV